MRESDLALVEALQRQPRASWVDLAKVLDAAPVTLARRWEQLRQAGLARVTVTPGPTFGRTGVNAFITADCEPARTDAIAQALLSNPRIATIQVTGGDPDLVLISFAPDIATLHTDVLRHLQQQTGVRAVCVSLTTDLHTEASQWRVQALDRNQSTKLGGNRAGPPNPVPRPDDTDKHLVNVLSQDGRMSYTELGAALGMSTTTVRRRLSHLTGSGLLRLRCDIATRLFGWPIVATLWTRAPSAHHDQIARELRSRPSIGVIASTTGRSNLLLQLFLPTIELLPQIEAGLAEKFPAIHIVNSTFDLRTLKRMGWELDEAGRSVRLIPLVLW
ncbi:Lrp/AsnC family transcriptional regulator [Amycolatopsis rubida]|uniref:Lrp/AsnC family transcriptional regulator n=1 Tax=Amycolatopsis rubida TaxID=112413 RepID=A0ABX0C757_9PSEU|nr:Lrp/AsnC family transcriptional regulator [Amycolatopsis sp. M39]MYW97993.1 AsnC family transcriptional regulator [Amycolatopsis rubida]NEC62978.1 Lrp/AsnC family transcriptional regulator [Amycolatopsis rubida]OAP24478.1 DNA-binding transcriptional regulator AsnC [Amycolatopsis sp. M39]